MNGISLDYSRFVVGYHGCDRSLARRVLLAEDSLQLSKNTYDWLGDGIYFWEHGPARAMQFAVDAAKRKSSKVSDPFVLGAYIFLGNCFDLLDTAYTDVLAAAQPRLIEDLKNADIPVPENNTTRGDGTKRNHDLDRAVIEFALASTETATGRRFDTVRGAFWEGGPAFSGSEIQRQSHIQIAVRNPDCIIGYFHPRNAHA